MQRRYPFGYKMVGGEFVADDEEREVVVNIYTLYLQNDSLQTIADKLSKQKIRYHEDKTKWNKNMITRILQNENYSDNHKYPSIICRDVFDRANLKRLNKGYTTERIDKVKPIKDFLVCQKCGEKLKRRLKTGGQERWYCPEDKNHIGTKILDSTILVETEIALSEYQIKKTNDDKAEDNAYIINLNREIDTLIEQHNSNSDIIKDMIMNVATERYNCCKNGQGEYERRVKILEDIRREDNPQELHYTIDLDKEKLEQFIDKLIVFYDGEIEIVERS